ncbi:MAG: FAD-binding oxidoreductase [Myxococcales bacterium]|nr:MAG: FAD-binding oxidoreductase [Myxococcales bacterium]
MLAAGASIDSLERDILALSDTLVVSKSEMDRSTYSADLWPRNFLKHEALEKPCLIVWPQTLDDLSHLLRFAARYSIPVVPYGGGSGVCGGIRPTKESIVLDLKRMRAVKTINKSALQVEVEAGCYGQELENQLSAKGFTLGHFPSSISCSTVGGWLATRSAGQCSGRYGKIEDMVLGFQAIDGIGRNINVQHNTSSATLGPLLIGNEGTLCVFGEASLRINPAPEHRRFAAFDFETIEDGTETIRRAFQAGLRPAVCRLYDPLDSAFAKRHLEHPEEAEAKVFQETRSGILSPRHQLLYGHLLRYPKLLGMSRSIIESLALFRPLLILVWEDNEAMAESEFRHFLGLAHEHGGDFLGERPAKHWFDHRHAVSFRQSPVMSAGAFVDTMEIAVGWSQLTESYYAVRRALSKHAFVMAHFSHAYPSGASIYFTFARHPGRNKDALSIYDNAWKSALDEVLRQGGSVSHHHGIGRAKLEALGKDSANNFRTLRQLKRVFDPQGILNPGALVPKD